MSTACKPITITPKAIIAVLGAAQRRQPVVATAGYGVELRSFARPTRTDITAAKQDAEAIKIARVNARFYKPEFADLFRNGNELTVKLCERPASL